MSVSLRTIVLCSLLCALGMNVPTQSHAAYPNRTINVIVPYLPGGWVEIITRPFVDAMSRELGVPMTVNPSPGAAGVIGITKALQAKPDGYTLVVCSDLAFSYHPLIRKVRYTQKDANPIYGVMQAVGLFATSKKQTKFQTFEEFVAYAKEHPGEVTVGVAGLNSIFLTTLVQMEQAYGINVQPIPFDGAVGITNAITSGHIDCGITEHTQNSELQPMLVSSGKSEYFPGVRDFSDLGYPQISSAYGMILMGQPKLPEDIRLKLEAVAIKAAEDPNYLRIVKSMAADTFPVKKDELLERIATDSIVVEQMIKDGVIVPEK